MPLNNSTTSSSCDLCKMEASAARSLMRVPSRTFYRNAQILPISISARYFSSARTLSLPPPLNTFGGGSSQGPSYFQRTQRLPTNTVVKFVPQQQAWVVERFGRFNRILDPGLAILIPLVDVSCPWPRSRSVERTSMVHSFHDCLLAF